MVTTTPAPLPSLSPSPSAAPVKPGWQTSEAWITFLIVLLGGLLSSGLVADLPTWGKVITFAIAALKAVTYTAARASIKRAALPSARVVSRGGDTAASAIATTATLLIGLVMISQMGACASSQLHTMTGSFSTCAKADLGQVVSSGSFVGDLVSVISAIIAQDAPTLEANLSALALTLGADAVTCAIAAVDAALTPAKTTAEPSPGLVRARAWAAQARTQAGAR
jgi:hypothetical protein